MTKKNKINFCKFCGSKVIFMGEMSDYYCPKCKMYQSTPATIKKGSSVLQVRQDVHSQVLAELYRLQSDTVSPWQENPFTPNRPLIVRKLKMAAGRFGVFDLENKLLGSIKMVPAIVDRDFIFLDVQNNQIAYVDAHVGLFEIQERKYDIFDNDKRLRGRIIRKREKDSPLLLLGIWKYLYEIYDGNERLIYRGIASKHISSQGRLVSNNRGGILFLYEAKIKLTKEESKIMINPVYDPILMLAYYMIIRYPEGK